MIRQVASDDQIVQVFVLNQVVISSRRFCYLRLRTVPSDGYGSTITIRCTPGVLFGSSEGVERFFGREAILMDNLHLLDDCAFSRLAGS